MGTVTVHNSVAADITVKIKGPNSPETSGKCHAGGDVRFDLGQMVGWEKDDQISISVHADAGVTRHNNAGKYDAIRDFRYKVSGSLDAFSVNGPL
jgi:hypothetical protein